MRCWYFKNGEGRLIFWVALTTNMTEICPDDNTYKLSFLYFYLKYIKTLFFNYDMYMIIMICFKRSVEKFNEAKLQEFNSNLTTVLLNCQQVTDEFACANLDFNKNQKEKLCEYKVCF